MSSLKELDLSRCFKVNDAGIHHILSIANLEKLHISETSVTAEGVKLLASLNNLSLLNLGGLPVDDISLTSLQVIVFSGEDSFTIMEMIINVTPLNEFIKSVFWIEIMHHVCHHAYYVSDHSVVVLYSSSLR